MIRGFLVGAQQAVISPRKNQTVSALFGLVSFSEDEMLQLHLRLQRWQRSEKVKRGVILVPSTPEPLLKSFNAE